MNEASDKMLLVLEPAKSQPSDLPIPAALGNWYHLHKGLLAQALQVYFEQVSGQVEITDFVVGMFVDSTHCWNAQPIEDVPVPTHLQFESAWQAEQEE